MIPIIQINFLLCKTEVGKNRVGSKQERGKERKRGLDQESERQSIGENWKWRVLRNDHWKRPEVFQINRTNKMSIKEDINILGGFNLAGLLCHDFHSP